MFYDFYVFIWFYERGMVFGVAGQDWTTGVTGGVSRRAGWW